MRSLCRVCLSMAMLPLAALPGVAQSGSFGNAIVVSDDEVIIAEPNTNFRPGAVYIYRKSGNAWSEAAQLHAPGADRADGFGSVLARTGNTLFVGQRGGPLHIFQKQGETWRATGTITGDGVTGIDPGCSQYGYCGTDFGIALAAAGDWLLVGEPGSRPPLRRGDPEPQPVPGVVYAFQRGADGSWNQRARLQPTEGVPGDRFGAVIALGENRALIGAPNWSPTDDTTTVGVGRVYEFRLENGAWSEAGLLESQIEANATFGFALAMAGDLAVIGAPGSDGGYGAAFLHSRDAATGVWVEQSRLAAFNGKRGDRFGAAVAVDGHDIWVGAPTRRGEENGLVYVYRGMTGGHLVDAPRRIRPTETVTRERSAT